MVTLCIVVHAYAYTVHAQCAQLMFSMYVSTHCDSVSVGVCWRSEGYSQAGQNYATKQFRCALIKASVTEYINTSNCL